MAYNKAPRPFGSVSSPKVTSIPSPSSAFTPAHATTSSHSSPPPVAAVTPPPSSASGLHVNASLSADRCSSVLSAGKAAVNVPRQPTVTSVCSETAQELAEEQRRGSQGDSKQQNGFLPDVGGILLHLRRWRVKKERSGTKQSSEYLEKKSASRLSVHVLSGLGPAGRILTSPLATPSLCIKVFKEQMHLLHRMESNLNQDGVPRPSYVFSADRVERPSEINFDAIKLDHSHEFSLVSSNTEAKSLESKDYLQVCLRIRPFTQAEKEHESEGCVHVVDTQTVLLKDPQVILCRLSEKSSGQMAQKFTFSRVFGPETSQKEFFQGCILQPVKDLLNGQSRLIFTYGLTNSGKTYTFQGTEENIGILPRTLNVLFDTLQKRLYTKMNLKPHRSREFLWLSPVEEKEEGAGKNALLQQIKEVAMHNESYDTLHGSLTNSLNILGFEESVKDCGQACLNMDNNIKFSVWVSFFEIYNECIYDLFVPVSSKFQKRKILHLSQDVKGYSFIKDLQWIQISDSKEAYRLFKLGIKNQSVAFTKLNIASSRSHSIFTIRILQIEDSEISHVLRVNCLYVILLVQNEA